MEYTEFNKSSKKVSNYPLRHFGITARLYAGVPNYNVSKLAGTNDSFLQNHYEHLDIKKLMDDAVKSFSIDEDGFILRD